MIDGLSRREAAKRFGVHRNTITKMLSFSVPPGYRRRKQRGLGKPETFTFLDFVLICGCSLRGRFFVKRKTRRDRMRSTLKGIREGSRRRLHRPIPETGKWLGQVVAGYFAYHAVPSNIRALTAFRHHVVSAWRWTLHRRSQRGKMIWERVKQLADDYLPKPEILHPWPEQRFAVKHPR
jgi:hypothetical protein